jgi:transcriptional regulator with XRE-family HTH domain
MKPVDRKPKAADEIVSENLRRLRTLSGLSQGELGERLGVTTQQIQKYERASNRLSAGAIVDIADVLGVEITDLFRGCRGTKAEIGRALSAGQLTVAVEFGKISDPRTRRLVSALIRTLAARPVQPEELPSEE